MGLLQEIRDGAVDSRTDIATVLRKCLILAEKLGHDGFKQWVERELNGYGPKDKLPPYRTLHVESLGHFTGAFGMQVRNQPIPPSGIPEKLRELVTTLPVVDGIAGLASLIEGKEDLEAPWPADLVALVAREFYQGRMVLVQAWRVVPRSLIVGIIDTVRNRILNFVLEIEKQDPQAGEVGLGAKPIPEERVAQIFNTYMMGAATAVAIGSSRFAQTVSQVQPGDRASLMRYLAELGIGTEDLQELGHALETDLPPQKPERFGEKVSAWLGRMVGKGASGAWQVGSSAAADVLGAAIRAYYGLPG